MLHCTELPRILPQSARKKLAKSVIAHLKGHEARMAKKAKDEQLALRRGASKVAREVRAFWAKLNKVRAIVMVRNDENLGAKFWGY